MRKLFVATCVFALSSCASTSFAPPQVKVHTYRVDGSVDAHCRVYADTDKPQAIYPNVDGAQALISNYMDSYRCAMREAANGRQPWEILSFLTLLSSTTASALGAGKNVPIVGTSINSVFQAGNGYYAPRDQVAILDDAVDALACIQNESVGIDPDELKNAADNQSGTRLGVTDSSGPGSVEVTAERQYFNMVYSALITTERAASKRLENRGFDAAGIQAQIDLLTQKINAAQTAQKNPAPVNPMLYGLPITRSDPQAAIDQAEALRAVQLDLAVLQPKLEKCALRAQGAG